MAKKKVVKRTVNREPVKDKEQNISFLSKLQGSLFYPGKFFSNLKETDIKPSLTFFIFVFLIYAVFAVIVEYNSVGSILNDVNPGLLIPIIIFALILAVLIGVAI